MRFSLCTIVSWHSGESRDFQTTIMADTIENTVDSGKTFFDIYFNTGQICMGFEAYPGKITATCPLYATFGQKSS